MKMVPLSERKLRKNAVAYKDYDNIIEASKIASQLDLDLTKIQGEKLAFRIRMGSDDFRTEVGRAIFEVIKNLRARRSKLRSGGPQKSGAAQRYNVAVTNAASSIESCRVRTWGMTLNHNVRATPELTVISCGQKHISVTMPDYMLYRAGLTHKGYLSYLTALYQSPLSGTMIFGISDEIESVNDYIGEVRIGLAAMFKTTEADKGMQWKWFCMGKQLTVIKATVGKYKVASCGFGTDPSSAEAAAVRMSAKFLRQEMRSN